MTGERLARLLETLANAAISTAIIVSLVAAYWLVAILELA